MIVFGDKMYLQAAWLIPVLILGYFLHTRYQKKMRQKLGDPVQVKKLLSGNDTFRKLLKFLLLIGAYGALVLALARPQTVGESAEKVTADEEEIIFAVDVSNSMLAADILPDRLTRARSFLLQAVRSLPGKQVGLVIFAGKAYPYLPLTSDFETAQSAIKTLTPNLMNYQGSSLKEGLKISGLLLQNKSGKPKIICLISDGESHQQNFGTMADSLTKAGIYLITIGIGTEKGESIPVQNEAGLVTFKKNRQGSPIISKLNVENLKRIVGGRSGQYILLETNEQAVAALSGALQKNDSRQVKGKAVKKEYYRHFLLLGFFLLLAELLIPAGGNKGKISIK